jgi:hypothetical protein
MKNMDGWCMGAMVIWSLALLVLVAFLLDVI